MPEIASAFMEPSATDNGAHITLKGDNMRCGDCRQLMTKDREEAMGHSRELKIQTWRCVVCLSRIEEIRIHSESRPGHVRRIRYVVRPWPSAA